MLSSSLAAAASHSARHELFCRQLAALRPRRRQYRPGAAYKATWPVEEGLDTIFCLAAAWVLMIRVLHAPITYNTLQKKNDERRIRSNDTSRYELASVDWKKNAHLDGNTMQRHTGYRHAGGDRDAERW